MSTQAYSTQAGRVNEVLGEMLAHAQPKEVLGLGCTMKQMPKKKGDNISYRRALPKGATATDANTQNRWSLTAAAHVVTEGVTPTAEVLTYQDVNVKIQQYACLYSYTDKAAELYEDDIPEDQKIQTAERMGLVREMIRYGVMKACTNVHYSGGTTRATVDERVNLTFLRNIAKGLLRNGTEQKTRILPASNNYDTSPVEAGFFVFCSTDIEPDIRDLPNFIPVAKYGASKGSISPDEIGSCERFRFIVSKELTAYEDSGAAIGATGLFSTTGTSIDVYPMIVVGAEAVYDIALRGDSMKVVHHPHNKTDKADLLGQRGYVGCIFWSAALVPNQGWMACGEVGTTDTAA